MEEIEDYERYSPLSAALSGRDDTARALVYEKFNKLPDEVSDVLVDVSTADTIQSWEQQGIFPATHGAAVAKLVALVILGEVSSEQVPELLKRLNLDPTTVQRTSEAIKSITAPALAFIQGYQTPASLGETEVPPLSVQRPVPMGSNTAPRNIIDLRKPPEAI